MHSHPLKPVEQPSSQTLQDAASQNYKTRRNYFHSNHNNNMPGQDVQGRGVARPAALMQRPAPRPMAAAPPPRATPLAGACFGNGRSRPEQSPAPLPLPVPITKHHVPVPESHSAGSPGPRQARATLCKPCSSFFNVARRSHAGLRSSWQC